LLAVSLLHCETGALCGAALTWAPLCATEPSMSNAIARMTELLRTIRDLTIRTDVHFENAAAAAIERAKIPPTQPS
jgi:hypothetical protein